MIDLSLFMGEFGRNPGVGEEWLITPVAGNWILERRTTFQNASTAALLASSPGQTVYSNHGKLLFTDTQVEIDGPPLIVSGVSRPVPRSIYHVTTASLASTTALTIPNWVPDLTNSTSTGLFTQNTSTGVFTAVTSGVYTFNFSVDTAFTVTTGRSFVQLTITNDPFPRRASFSLDNYGFIGSTVSMEAGDHVSCTIFHTSAAARVITGYLEIIGMV
jgi:hypothetical protein